MFSIFHRLHSNLIGNFIFTVLLRIRNGTMLAANFTLYHRHSFSCLFYSCALLGFENVHLWYLNRLLLFSIFRDKNEFAKLLQGSDGIRRRRRAVPLCLPWYLWTTILLEVPWIDTGATNRVEYSWRADPSSVLELGTTALVKCTNAK